MDIVANCEWRFLLGKILFSNCDTLNSLLCLSYIAPSDYIGGTFPVTIRERETMGSLSITTIKTDLVEDDEDFKAILSNPDGPDNVMVGINTSYVTIFDSTGE